MKVITAPEFYHVRESDITVFLAGGITNCENWQKEVIDVLKSAKDTDNLVVFNPRRDIWPSNSDLDEVKKQIEWEFEYLSCGKCLIFSMYFTNTKESDQPICFYELGRCLSDRCYCHSTPTIISCQEGFRREFDVVAQTELIADHTTNKNLNVNVNFTPKQHAQAILKGYHDIMGVRNKPTKVVKRKLTKEDL